MDKRKAFVKSDLSIPSVNHTVDAAGVVHIPKEAIPPKITKVTFNGINCGARSYDFAKWYGVGLDQITYACQIQIERFSAQPDSELSVETIRAYCQGGMKHFLNFASMHAMAIRRPLQLGDVNRHLIDGFLAYLRDSGVSRSTQKSRYHAAKAVLKGLCERALIEEQLSGDEMTFPRNPFAQVHHSVKGEKPLTKHERVSVAAAIHKEIQSLFIENIEVTSSLIACAVLLVALYTGRNTTPLLEMPPNCLRPHPKSGMMFLALYKRRGHSTSKIAIRSSREFSPDIESSVGIRATVFRLLERVIEVTAPLRAIAPQHLSDRMWLYSMQNAARGVGGKGITSALTTRTLSVAITSLIAKYKLVNADGNPLRLNISRLRKSFGNRIHELVDGDIASTSVALGDTVQVVDQNYLSPGEDALANWNFMGKALVAELLTGTLGATERTPVGQCSDVINGEFAPKNSEKPCMRFLDCLRCRNYVVTGDDLHRLFSFYWRILGERARVSPRRWQQLAHIVRLIDRDVIEAGIERRIFKRSIVDAERARARKDPHPFWRNDDIIGHLSGGSI